MKTSLLFVVLAGFIALSLCQEIIPHHYLIQFQPSSSKSAQKLHFSNITAHPLYQSSNSSINAKWDFEAFSGYAARIKSSELLTYISTRPEVLIVEPDQIVRKSQDSQCSDEAILATGLWGLARISSTPIPPTGSPYIFPVSAGEGTNAYIIDTGILTTHDDFYPSRAIQGANFISNEPATDLNGHGTHVAGTVGGNTYGIAKKCTLIAVKVLDRSGSGTLSGVISGMNWVASDHKKNDKPSTANLSLGASFSATVNDATNNLVAAGVSVIVAAGNSNAVSCRFSPASATRAISTAASDRSDIRAYFSNYGNCTDIFAPGVNVLSAYIGGNGASATLSGTSMAAPHVAGVATIYLGLFPKSTPEQVKTWIVSSANLGMITDPQGTPNRLLFQGCYGPAK